MADWFKFYENDIDETRLQYAIQQLAEVLPVWVGILSECCRHKSDTVRWGSNEIELFGFSHRLNVSSEKVGKAVELLKKIDYIELSNNQLKVLRWSKKQSEYCQKIQSRSRDKVGTKSGQCPLRGEERRREESTEYTHSEDVRRMEKTPQPAVESATPEACVLAEKPENPNGKNRELFELQQRTEWLKAEIGKIYRRPIGCCWVHDEETLLCEVARRPASKSEYREIAAYRGRLAPQDRRFFPQSIRSLLTGWNATLDKARVHVDTTPKTVDDKILDENIRAAKKTIEYLNRYEASSQV